MGRVLGEPEFIYKGELLALDRVLAIYENKLESVYSCNIPEENVGAELFSFQAESRPAPAIKCARPRVLIPVFPGTNCEFDSARACIRAGMEAETVVVRNLSAEDLLQSTLELERAIQKAQILFLPGGFSGGDEPDGSAKFICSLFRNPGSWMRSTTC